MSRRGTTIGGVDDPVVPVDQFAELGQRLQAVPGPCLSQVLLGALGRPRDAARRRLLRRLGSLGCVPGLDVPALLAGLAGLACRSCWACHPTPSHAAVRNDTSPRCRAASTSVGFRPAAIGTQVITGDPQRAAFPVRRPERRARRPVGSRHRVRRQRVHRRLQWPGSEGRHGAQTRRVSIGCIRQRRRDAAHLVEGAPLTAWSGCDARWPARDGHDRS